MSIKGAAVIGVVTACVLLVLGAPSASANVIWCEDDPPIQVETPGGHNLTVNNHVYLPATARLDLHRVTAAAIAAPDGSGGTLITVHIYVPAGVSAHVVSSVNRAGVTSQGQGSGVITLYLDVPIS